MQCGEVGYLGNYFLYQKSGKEFSTLHLQQEKTKNEKNNLPNCVIKNTILTVPMKIQRCNSNQKSSFQINAN